MGKDQETLIDAARNGNIEVVEKILQRAKRSGPLASLRRGPGANYQECGSGWSALHHATVNKHSDIVELLLSHEASTNIIDLQGSTPLHLGAWTGEVHIMELLLTHGPSVPNVNLMNQSLETALHMGAQYGHVEVCRLLLKHGADPLIPNSKGETCLDLAAQFGKLETVQLLLKSHPALLAPYTSATPNVKLFPHTPLHYASRNGHRSVVEALVLAGFNVNSRTVHGTALHEASLCGKREVVRELLDAGIDVCVTDSQRRTAVDRLQEVGLKTPVAKEIAEMIRGALKKSHMQSGKGSSPLCSPYENSPICHEGKLPLSQIFDNHSHNDTESTSRVRHSYSPRQSPKANNSNFVRGKTRRSMDAQYMPQGPEFDKAFSQAPPKKPPRRNLSASPTHPGPLDGDSSFARNKSLDESVYSERWRKSVTSYCETSQSTDSIDISPVERDHHKSSSCAKSDIAFLNGLVDEDSKSKSKSQHQVSQGLDNNFVSVAHIKLRDAKSEQNVSPGGLERLEVKAIHDGGTTTTDNTPVTQTLEQSSNNNNNNNNNNNSSRNNNNNNNNNSLLHHHYHVDNASSNNQIQSKEPKEVKEVVKQKPLGPKPTIAPKPVIAPKPKNIKRQGQSCDNVLDDKKRSGTPKKGTHKSASMSVLSPVDVDKEWESIAKFMDSLSVKMGDVETGGDGEGVGAWLASLTMEQYEKLLLTNGFNDMEFLGEDILDENSLLEIGILNAQHRKVLTDAASKLKVSWPTAMSEKTSSRVPVSVEKWLQELHLDQYVETFRKNLYTDPERLQRLWNDELTTVLDISIIGHRRRILKASAKISGLRHPISSSSSSSGGGGGTSCPRVENGIEIDETQSDGSLPQLREPNDLVSGVCSAAIKTKWRHTPQTLIEGYVTYKAIYVGSSYVQEFSTTDLIQGAIQRIRGQQQQQTTTTTTTTNSKTRNPETTTTTTTVFNINVTLIVSATVVSWYNAQTKSLVKEHDIGNIQCTCQASDDLRHLALVTKASDPSERSHSCHVFCLDSVDVATEAILTLGQAFEIAYMLAVTNRSQTKDHKGHTRSKSANQLYQSTESTVCAKLKRDSYQSHIPTNNHCRSVNDIDTPPVLLTTNSASNSPQTQPHHKDHLLPRAESFSFSSHSTAFTRAPIVSKEEL